MEEERKKKIEIAKPVYHFIYLITSSSSLGLELFLVIDKYYSVFYYIVEFLLFIFKRFVFPYPYKRIIPEVIVMILLLIINLIRIKITSMGNKTERALIILIGVILGVLNLIGYLYYLFWQTYSTYYDASFNGIGLFLLVVEVIAALIAMFNIKAHEKTI